MACFYVRLGLLAGRFDPAPSGGILDETHLHFYTRRTAEQLLERAGLRVVRTDWVPAPSVWAYQAFAARRGRSNGAVPPRARDDDALFLWYERYVYPVEHALTGLWPTLFANQLIFVAQEES